MRSKSTRVLLERQHGHFDFQTPTMIDSVQVVIPLWSTLEICGLTTLDGCPVTWMIGLTHNAMGVHEPPQYAQRGSELRYAFADPRDQGKAFVSLLSLEIDPLQAR